MTTAELILFLLGSVLVAVAALAWRAQARGTGRVSIGPAVRIATAAAGALCLAAALILTGSEDYSKNPVTVTIANELGPDQVSEDVRVFLDGRHVGLLRIDEQSPKARLTVTVGEAGRHDYRLEAKRQIKDRKPIRASNTGEVVIGANSRLAIFSNGKDTFLVRLD